VASAVGAPMNVLALPTGQRSASWPPPACGKSQPAVRSLPARTGRWQTPLTSCWTRAPRILPGIASRATRSRPHSP